LQKPFAESALLGLILNLLQQNSSDAKAAAALENPTFDLAELERMLGGDTVFFNEMLNIFIRSSEDALDKIRQNYRDKNWTSLSETAHKLAAPAKHLQATALYSRLKKLEITNENSHPEAISNLIDEIEKEITYINSVLKQKLNTE
jgi:HPt (histidine-containing phosphotransfer) domain-containing protein